MGAPGVNDHAKLKVLLADEDPQALASTAALVRELGHQPTELAVRVDEIADAIARDEPDVSLVVVHREEQHALDLIEEIGEFSAGPVVAVLTQEDPDFVRRAAERGIHSYARQETPTSMQSAIEIALRRWEERRELRDDLQRAQSAMERRSVIERAKGILMERHGISEPAAFERLREHARSRNRTVVDVAASVLEGHALLPPKRTARD
ncbi:MAG: ANTAR domain-containing response regulator [Solirubrobacteraceae bacterium]